MKIKIKHLIIFSVLFITVASMSFKQVEPYVMAEYMLRSTVYGYDPRPSNLIFAEFDSTASIYFCEEYVGRIGRIDVDDTGTGDTVDIREWILPYDPLNGYAEPWDLDDSSTYIWYTAVSYTHLTLPTKA